KHDGVRFRRREGARRAAAGRDPHREPSLLQSAVQAAVRVGRNRGPAARAVTAAARPRSCRGVGALRRSAGVGWRGRAGHRGGGAAGGGAGAHQEGGGGARRRCAGGRAAAGGGNRTHGGPGGHHGRAGAPADASRRVPRDARRGGGGRQAARLPRAGAVARGEHHRLEGERCGDHPVGDRDERRAREVPGAAREPGVTPRVVVLSAPSGGGKTTIAKALLARRPDIGYSVSATTRPPRPGEQNGVAYHFLSRDEFARRRDAGEFVEWAEYAGEWYGTLQSEVDRVLRSGRHVLLDIDVQGAAHVQQRYPPPQSIGIFILPPS